MAERLKFVQDALSDRFTMRELCARYGVNRRIGSKCLACDEAEGRPGLRARRRAPHQSSHRILKADEALLVRERQAHPFWGARTLLTVLETRDPKSARWPAASTVGHRALKRQAIQPVRTIGAAQPRNFDTFLREYSTEGPHERLGQASSASQDRTSPRPYPDRLPIPEYPGHFLAKKITTGETLRLRDRVRYFANAMVNQHIGREETDDGIWAIHLNTVLLATFVGRGYRITGELTVLPMLRGLRDSHHPDCSRPQ